MGLREYCKAFIGLTLLLSPIAVGQTEWQQPETAWLQEVMPGAQEFVAAASGPPLYLAFGAAGDGDPPLIGYVFATPALPPEEAGFSGPIDVLLGMDLDGRLTGVKVLFYRESYKHVRGDFIGESDFPAQFIGKRVEDEFRIGQDIDGMARATISSWAMARGIRNAARRVAQAYLPDSDFAVSSSADAEALQWLQARDWDALEASGFVREFAVPLSNGTIRIAVAYMGHYRLGEMLIGSTDYSNADRSASSLVEDGHMLLLALDGNTERLQQARLAAMQDGVIYPHRGERVVFAGTAREGKIAGQARMAIAYFIDAAVDIERPFAVLYDTSPVAGEFSDYVGIDYRLPAAMRGLLGDPLRTDTEDDLGQREEWEITTWSDLAPALGLLAILLLVLNRKRLMGLGTE